VVENFLMDHVGNEITQMELRIDECIKSFLNSITATAQRLPNTKFGIVLPLGRPAIKWYQSRLSEITDFIKEGIAHILTDKSVNNIVKINCISLASQQFEKDAIHLTPASGKIFLDVVLDEAERFFNSDLIVEEEDENFDDARSEVRSVEQRLDAMEEEIRNQKCKNRAYNLMMARLREETDTSMNRSKEDRIVMTGLSSSTPLPQDLKSRVTVLKTIVGKIFETLIKDFNGKILFLNQGKSNDQLINSVEVRLDSVTNATALRKAFAERRSKGDLPDNLQKLFVTNCVNLATRIRIDILKSIAKKLTTTKEIAYVSGFISRPMMHIKKVLTSSNSRPVRSYTFIDAVSKFGDLVRAEDLTAAYGRAGSVFDGQIEQNFIVLNKGDLMSFRAGSGGGGGRTRGTTGPGSSRGYANGGNFRGTKRPASNLGSNEKFAKK
jgi:hypothetical protein